MGEKKWYGVHTYSGYENKVKLNLEERIRSLGAEEFFGEVLIPSETVVELKNGERKTSTRKFFPGYILVHVELNNETWHIVKDTPKVTGFVGGGTTPPPIPDDLDPEPVRSALENPVGFPPLPTPFLPRP